MPVTRPSVFAVFAALVLLSGLTPAVSSEGLAAQAVEPRTPVERLEIGGRFHLQFNSTSVEGAVPSEFLVRRARIWVAARVNDWIDGAVQVDLAGPAASARYAFVRFSLSPAARIAFGQFKRAFDNFELTSSADILVVERDGFVRGVFDCAGVGGVCSYSRFSEQLAFSSLDVGVLLQGETRGGTLGYLFSVTNGSGPNRREENGAKSFSGRVEWAAVPGLKLGANAGVHDYYNDVRLRDAYAPATALDAEYGDFQEGLHLQAGIMAGRNWLNLRPDGGESSFVSWQGIVAYRIPLDGHRVRAVEPVGRVSWGDPDRDAAGDGGLLLTPGLVLHFEGHNKIAANVDIWHPQSGGTAWGLKAQTYLHF
jgi:hypothetical protein